MHSKINRTQNKQHLKPSNSTEKSQFNNSGDVSRGTFPFCKFNLLTSSCCAWHPDTNVNVFLRHPPRTQRKLNYYSWFNFLLAGCTNSELYLGKNIKKTHRYHTTCRFFVILPTEAAYIWHVTSNQMYIFIYNSWNEKYSDFITEYTAADVQTEYIETELFCLTFRYFFL